MMSFKQPPKVFKLPSQANFKRVLVVSGDYLDIDYQQFDDIQELEKAIQNVLEYLNVSYEIRSGNNHLTLLVKGKEVLNIAVIIYD